MFTKGKTHIMFTKRSDSHCVHQRSDSHCVHQQKSDSHCVHQKVRFTLCSPKVRHNMFTKGYTHIVFTKGQRPQSDVGDSESRVAQVIVRTLPVLWNNLHSDWLVLSLQYSNIQIPYQAMQYNMHHLRMPACFLKTNVGQTEQLCASVTQP